MSKIDKNSENLTVPRLISHILYGSGILVLFLSITVLIGWHTQNYFFVQISPDFPPVQYNTALALFLLGLGLLSVIQSPRLTVLLGILVFSIGAITLAEYIFYVNLGIDQLFMNATPLIRSSFPGRMTPNTALCLSLASVALFFNLKLPFLQEKRVFALTLSAVILMLGFIALIGYVANLPTSYAWGSLTGMNILTAICFTAVGAGLLAFSLRYFIRDELLGRNILPVLVVLIGNVYFLQLWQAQVADQNHNIILKEKYDAEEIKTNIDEKLKAYAAGFALMGKFMEFRNPISKSEWLFDAKLLLHEIKPMKAIAWKPETQNVKWEIGSNATSVTNQTQQMIQRCFDLARTNLYNSDILISIPAEQNIEYFCIIRNASAGQLIGLVDTQSFLTSILNNSKYDDYQISLNKEKAILVVHPVSEPVLSSDWTTTLRLEKINTNLQMNVRPTEAVLKKNISIYPLMALITGPLLTILLAFALRFWMIAKQEKIDLVEAMQIIQHQANYDALTDLPNRILFKERLKLSLSQADRLNTWVSLLSIDLDGFKLVNDQYGHDVGDELLKQTSQRLLHCIRQTDTATRLGGDEFAIILTNLHAKDEMELVSRKILGELSKPFVINNISISISGSIGIALYPSDTRDQKDLIIKADQAMYMAKKSGKSKHCFFSS